ncbi:MAG: glutaminase domain-containing protein, partial [Solirubrobacterales bacterium]
QLGMNLARKHVKVEPDRWYYWCDKLGLLVWQDMPSGDAFIGGNDPDVKRTEESAKQYDLELTRIIDAFRNHPCIVMWVPFNEGWGQFDTPRVVDMVRKLDPTRLVDNASGWTDRGVGDVHDIHTYPGPDAPRLEPNRAGVLGEFGGLGLPLPGHTWQAEKNWGYRSYATRDELTDAYVGLIKKLRPLTGTAGLAAAVYTQTTDVEVEVNGLMTYDRELIKMDADRIAAVNKTLYTKPEPRRSEGDKLIPPAAPLVACDPYFSIWSQADNLTDEDTTHWTGKPHRLTSMVRVDGKTYRVMGVTPGKAPTMKQTGLTVLPTRTIYTFEGAGVALTLTFMTAALPEDIDILSRPVTYLTYEFRATDGASHDVQVYFDASAELTVNTGNQQVVWSSEDMGKLAACKIGSKDQPILAKKGDDIRIDWGYLYIAAPMDTVASRAFASRGVLQTGFVENGLQKTVTSPQAPAGADGINAAVVLKAQKVSKKPVSQWLMVAYDDLYSIQYMKKDLRPYWRRNGWEAEDLLKAAAKDYESLTKRCTAFDEILMADLTKAGGVKYAKLAALAYRQCFAAGKFVADTNGQPMQFCKENHSNGCIGTSDVFYPMAPQFLLFGPSVAKSFLVPFMNYAASDRWKFPFAPHDLGQYPHANGQVYGGGERTEENQMPVEESGNLLLLITAVAQMEGNPKFASLYWPQLEKWAEYLKAKGFDPENQLCTDDFAGHLAHNVNLSAKAICGLGAFGKLCDMRGDKAKAAEYSKIAKEFAARWVKEADSGDHFRLAFDKPDTWSQKYNLVWDRILGLNLFPDEVKQKEMAYYKKIQNKYGLPLDNRSLYTKLDWVLWTATLTQNREDFEALVNPVFLFLNETPNRSPMTDWYYTDTARKQGFTARPVVGGVFIQMLYDKAVWKKYAGRDKTKAKGWAPMPKAPKVVTVVPSAQEEPAMWRYTMRRPGEGWFKTDFNASSWREGKSGFGTAETPGAIVNTVWDTRDIWLRREFTLPEGKWGNLGLSVHHDEDVEIYINGVQAATANGYTTEYEPLPVTPAAKAVLKPGKNVIAVHCRQTGGGQYIDLGLVEIIEQK